MVSIAEHSNRIKCILKKQYIYIFNPLMGVGTFLHHARLHWAGVGAFLHHPERRFVYYGFSQVQPTKVFVEGTFISHMLSLCFLLSFMASRAKISSDPAVLLEYYGRAIVPLRERRRLWRVPRARGRTSSVCNCSWGSRTGRAMFVSTAPALDRRPYRCRSIRASRIAIYELRVTHARPTF